MGFVVKVEMVKWCGDGSSSLELGVFDRYWESAMGVRRPQSGMGNREAGMKIWGKKA
jgi:hypothetical protein